VKCFYDGVGAVALGFGRQAVDESAGNETSDGRGDRDEPESVRTNRLAERAALFRKPRRKVTCEPDEEDTLREVQHPHEELRAEAADDPEDH